MCVCVCVGGGQAPAGAAQPQRGERGEGSVRADGPEPQQDASMGPGETQPARPKGALSKSSQGSWKD